MMDECDGICVVDLIEFDPKCISQWSGNTIHTGVLTQGKELEWGQGRAGRTEGDDEAFAGQVQPIDNVMRTIILIVLLFHSF